MSKRRFASLSFAHFFSLLEKSYQVLTRDNHNLRNMEREINGKGGGQKGIGFFVETAELQHLDMLSGKTHPSPI